MIGFDHSPLLQITYDSTSQTYNYVFDDSLQGFWFIKPDGSGLHRAVGFDLPRADWNPGSNRLAYEGPGGIWKIDRAGDSLVANSATFISYGSSSGFQPDWNPDGIRVIFAVTMGSGAGLRVTSITGGPSVAIGDRGWVYPRWHPHGAGILFVGQVGGHYGLGVCDTLGRAPEYLGRNGDFPAWSPDGSRIAYLSHDGTTGSMIYQLWVVDSRGGSPEQLTTNGAGVGFCWSPDGTEIAYIDYRSLDHGFQNGTIWIVNVNTKVRRQLTFN